MNAREAMTAAFWIREVVYRLAILGALVVFMLVALQGSAKAQVIVATQFNPGDGQVMTGSYVAMNYSAIGPGGANAGWFVYGYKPLNGSCGGGAISYPALAVYRYYGQHVGSFCGSNGSVWSLIELPAVTACLTGYFLQGGACVPDGTPPPVGDGSLTCTLADSEMACLTRRINALIEQLTAPGDYDAIAGFGFFSLTMGGILFSYFFSVGIGLILKGVKEW